MLESVLENSDHEVLRIFVVRHGRTDWNSKRILQGHKDIDINEEGISQAQRVGHYLRLISIDRLVSSDLVRCVNTSKPIVENQAHLTKAFPTTSSLRERHMGDAEGMVITDAIAKFGEGFRNLAEPRESLLERVFTIWDGEVELSKKEGYRNIVLCTHGGVVTELLNHLYDERNFSIPEHLSKASLRVPFNTGISVIDVHKPTGMGIIHVVGVTPHLSQNYIMEDQELR